MYLIKIMSQLQLFLFYELVDIDVMCFFTVALSWTFEQYSDGHGNVSEVIYRE